MLLGFELKLYIYPVVFFHQLVVFIEDKVRQSGFFSSSFAKARHSDYVVLFICRNFDQPPNHRGGKHIITARGVNSTTEHVRVVWSSADD